MESCTKAITRDVSKDCPSTRTDEHQLPGLAEQPEDSQTVHVAFPIAEDDFRSSNPIHLSVIDGQVIQLTSRPVIGNGKKTKRVDPIRCHEEIRVGHTDREKSIEKALTFITSNEKTYILPPGISSEGDYLLAEEVLCEDILHSSNMLPEEQILTIPSPSPVEFATGTKPDALAIAASEVFSDSCISLPLHESRCISEPIECQISQSKSDSVSQGNSWEGYAGYTYRLHDRPPFSNCVGANRLTGTFAEKLDASGLKVDQIYLLDHKRDQIGECKKTRLLKNLETSVKANDGCDVDEHNSKPPKWCVVPADALHDSNQSVHGSSTAFTVTEEKKSDLKEVPHDILENSTTTPKKTFEYLQPLSLESTSHLLGCCYEGSSSDQVTTSAGSVLRRSPRIQKVKKDPELNENSCSEEPLNRRKRRVVRGDAKRPLWDCVKCDAMFRTKASRNRHMQDGHLFTCYMCKWQGLTKTNYEIHISTVHCSQKARCLTCRKDFPNYGEYREHLETTHSQVTTEDGKSTDTLADDGVEEKVKVKGRTIVRKTLSQSDAEDNVDDPGYVLDQTIDDEKSLLEVAERMSIKKLEMEELQDEGKRVCPYCGKKFERHGRFIRHLNYHLGNKAFRCKFCQKSFVEKSGLEAHLITHSPINEPCPQCGKIFKTHRTMKRHLRTHLNNLYGCSLCPKQFRHEESLRVHRSIHKEGGSGNVCSYCEKDCKTPYYLQLHMTNKHEAPKFSCKMCNRSFKWKQSYRKHMVIHNENSSAGMKYKCIMTYPNLNVHQKKYICDLCGKCFKHEYTRDKHVKVVHQEEHEHMCPQCGTLFKAKGYLDQHIAQVHTTKERVKCQTCGHDFKTESILKSHIKLVHKSTNGKYSCEVCKKTFSAPKDLARHTKVHTGEKNHICPLCRRCFSRKDNMTSHLRTHSRDMQDPLPVPQNSDDTAKDIPQSNTQESLQILGLSPVIHPSNTNVTSSNLQPIMTPSANIMDSVTSLVSGSITFSALPLPSISLPSSISSSMSNTVVYSNTSASSTCIVLSSKPSSSALPVVVFSGSTVSNSHILSNSQPTLSNVSLANIHPSINDFPINPPSTSPSNLSSVTTLTYCNNANVSLAPPSSNHLYAASANQASSSTPHLSLSSITPVSSNSVDTCVESVSQEPSAFDPSLHAEQIVLAEEVLASTSSISSQP